MLSHGDLSPCASGEHLILTWYRKRLPISAWFVHHPQSRPKCFVATPFVWTRDPSITMTPKIGWPTLVCACMRSWTADLSSLSLARVQVSTQISIQIVWVTAWVSVFDCTESALKQRYLLLITAKGFRWKNRSGACVRRGWVLTIDNTFVKLSLQFFVGTCQLSPDGTGSCC